MNKKKVFILALILIGAFLRFYNLNWGAPYYFHPDERNVIDLILKTSLLDPKTLLSGTFAYGNFPVILTLLLKPLLLPILKSHSFIDPFAQTIIVLRAVSAFFSVLMLYVIYLCGKFWSEKIALLALFLSVFSTGLIQQAHYGTYDGFAAFCSVAVLYFLLRFIKNKGISNFYLSILFIAMGAAAKINLLILTILPIAALFLSLKRQKKNFLRIFIHSVLGIISLIFLTVLFSPNYLTPEFRHALFYERGLVTGTTPVFYTQSFFGTTPVVFQFLHILPFLINPLLTIAFIPAFFYVFYKGIKEKNLSFLILVSFFLVLFLPQAFLHAKWTRYMVPTLPFVYLIISVTIVSFLSERSESKDKRHKSLRQAQAKTTFVIVILFASIIFSLSYFITVFVKPDSRIAANKFAQDNIPQNAKALTEVYDLGIMPFSSVSTDAFNFYDLDPIELLPHAGGLQPHDHEERAYGAGFQNLALEEELKSKLTQSEYIILPSQRLLRSRMLNPNKFPKGHGIYSLLINDAIGFQKIYETPCDIFCKIAYLNDPVFGFEETAVVFDHPTVMIFKKTGN